MERTSEAFAAALSSGETARTNEAIDELEAMESEERAALFETCLERCRDLYESDDGYQREAVIRFAATLYPRLEFQTVGVDLTDEALPGTWTLDEIAIHRRQLRDLYFEALTDDDGRVRRAAAKALKQLALTTEMIGADDELQAMVDELETLLASHDGDAKQKHIEQAYENVTLFAERPGSVLPEGLRDAIE